jgi:hypothetical protein
LKVVEFVTPLGSDGRRRTRHVRIGNKIIEFVVQYELKINIEWHPVVRYDTSHGFAHKDKLSYRGEAVKEALPFNDFNLALTFAEKDLKDNWQKYRERFLKEVKESD